MGALELTLWAILALSFASFANVLIVRVPDRKSINGRSHCLICEHEITAIENIPVLSFIFLRGRCSQCKSRISWRYPAVELLTLMLVLFVITRVDGVLLQVTWFIFVVAGLALAAIDLEHHRLPNLITLPLALVVAALLLIQSLSDSSFRDFEISLISSLTLTTFYLLVHLLSRGGMGMGDVKFALSIGLITGFGAPLGTYIATMIAFIAGSIIGLALIITKRGGRKTQVPLGPFMYLGAVASLWAVPVIEKALG